MNLLTPEGSTNRAADATPPATQQDSSAPHNGESGTMEAPTIPASLVPCQEDHREKAPAAEHTDGHESTQEHKDESTTPPKANAQPSVEQQDQAATPPAAAEASSPGQQLMSSEPAASTPEADQPEAPKEAVIAAEPTAPQQPTPEQANEKPTEPATPTPKANPTNKAIEKAAKLPPVTEHSKKEMYENGSYWKYLDITYLSSDIVTWFCCCKEVMDHMYMCIPHVDLIHAGHVT